MNRLSIALTVLLVTHALGYPYNNKEHYHNQQHQSSNREHKSHYQQSSYGGSNIDVLGRELSDGNLGQGGLGHSSNDSSGSQQQEQHFSGHEGGNSNLNIASGFNKKLEEVIDSENHSAGSGSSGGYKQGSNYESTSSGFNDGNHGIGGSVYQGGSKIANGDFGIDGSNSNILKREVSDGNLRQGGLGHSSNDSSGSQQQEQHSSDHEGGSSNLNIASGFNKKLEEVIDSGNHSAGSGSSGGHEQGSNYESSSSGFNDGHYGIGGSGHQDGSKIANGDFGFDGSNFDDFGREISHGNLEQGGLGHSSNESSGSLQQQQHSNGFESGSSNLNIASGFNKKHVEVIDSGSHSAGSGLSGGHEQGRNYESGSSGFSDDHYGIGGSGHQGGSNIANGDFGFDGSNFDDFGREISHGYLEQSVFIH